MAVKSFTINSKSAGVYDVNYDDSTGEVEFSLNGTAVSANSVPDNVKSAAYQHYTQKPSNKTDKKTTTNTGNGTNKNTSSKHHSSGNGRVTVGAKPKLVNYTSLATMAGLAPDQYQRFLDWVIENNGYLGLNRSTLGVTQNDGKIGKYTYNTFANMNGPAKLAWDAYVLSGYDPYTSYKMRNGYIDLTNINPTESRFNLDGTYAPGTEEYNTLHPSYDEKAMHILGVGNGLASARKFYFMNKKKYGKLSALASAMDYGLEKYGKAVDTEDWLSLYNYFRTIGYSKHQARKAANNPEAIEKIMAYLDYGNTQVANPTYTYAALKNMDLDNAYYQKTNPAAVTTPATTAPVVKTEDKKTTEKTEEKKTEEKKTEEKKTAKKRFGGTLPIENFKINRLLRKFSY